MSGETVYKSGTITPVVSNRSVADAVTNTTTTVTSATASFVSGDVGRIIAGGDNQSASSADFGVFNYIATVSSGTTALCGVAETAGHTAQTLVLTQEFILNAAGAAPFGYINAAGGYQLNIDINAMAAGDVMELRAYRMTLTGGTPRPLYVERFSGVPPTSNVIWDSQWLGTPLTDTFGLVFTLKQTAGTARAFPWSIMTV